MSMAVPIGVATYKEKSITRVKTLTQSARVIEIARTRAVRQSVQIALIFCLLFAVSVGLYFYWSGFHQTGKRFLLHFVGLFFVAPVVGVLATTGVFYLAMEALRPSSFVTVVEFEMNTQELEYSIMRRLLPSDDDSVDEEIGKKVSSMASTELASC